MEWTQKLIDRLDLAFNESQVFGLAFDPAAGEVRLRLDVLALPEAGPLDPDPRRVIIFEGVSTVQVRLEPDFAPQPRPCLPLESLDAANDLLATFTHAGQMYGWSFIDREAEHLPTEVSLILSSGRTDAAHSFWWFTEGGRRVSEDETESLVLEGVVSFDQLRVERADGSQQPLEDFLSDAQRWWNAFQAGDERLSSDAQRQANATAASWGPQGGTSTMVPGGSSDG